MSRIPPQAAVLIAAWSRDGQSRSHVSSSGRRSVVRRITGRLRRDEGASVPSPVDPASTTVQLSHPKGSPASV